MNHVANQLLPNMYIRNIKFNKNKNDLQSNDAKKRYNKSFHDYD